MLLSPEIALVRWRDKSAEYTVVGAFAFHLRRMFNARVLMDKRVHTSQIAKQLRIWGNVDGFFAQVRRLSLERIGEILARLADIDYAIKTGRTTARVAIEQLVLNLASSRS
jgi:DNA polymerase III delta subunit